MNKMGTWFWLSCKRQLKKPFFFLLLFLLPVGMWLFHRAESEDSGKISIALFTDGDEWNQKVAETLMEEEHSFEFYLCETREKLMDDVAAGRAECGYSFSAGLRSLLESGDYKRSIRVTVSPSTVAAALSTETVFAGLFRVYGRELLEQYAMEGAAFETARDEEADPGAVWTEVEALYERYLADGSTFAFRYETVGGGTVRQDSAAVSFPVRGIGAVFIFVMGLSAAVTAGEDEARGLFAAMASPKKRAAQAVQLSSSVFLACVSVFFSLPASGTFRGAGKEAAALAVYAVLNVLFSGIILRLVRNPLVISGLIPFFILGSLTVCPIFADLSVFVPVLTVLRRFFLPWYYLIL